MTYKYKLKAGVEMDENMLVHDTGYGLIPRKVMRDSSLSIQAKSLYAYLASFAGNTGRAFPSTELMIEELGVSRNTLFKYMKELRDKEVIVVEKGRTEEGTFDKNIYYLKNEVKKSPCTKKPDAVKPDMDKPDMDSSYTNSNNLNSNNLNNNNHNYSDGRFSEIITLYNQQAFGVLGQYTRDELISLSEEYGDEWLLEAMQIAIDNNSRNMAYVKGILKKWRTKGKDARKPKETESPHKGMKEF